MGQALLLGTLVTLITWFLLTTLGRRWRPEIQGAFWLIVLLKFAVPIGPEFSFSLATVGQRVSGLVTGMAQERPFMAIEDGNTPPVTPLDTAPQMVPISVSEKITLPSSTSGTQVPWSAVLALIYLGAVATIIRVRLHSYFRLGRRVGAVPEAGEDTKARVAAWCRRLGVKRIPVIRVGQEVPGPFVLGIRRPTMVLSEELLQHPHELDVVILHEISHLKWGDIYMRCLQWVVGSLLFFWPVVAWVNRRIDLVREHTCDAVVLKYGRLSAGEYARFLHRMARHRNAWNLAYGSAAMVSNSSMVERRIEMILQKRNSGKGKWIQFFSAAVLLVWGSFVLTGADQPAEPAPEAEEAPEAERAVVAQAPEEPPVAGKPVLAPPVEKDPVSVEPVIGEAPVAPATSVQPVLAPSVLESPLDLEVPAVVPMTDDSSWMVSSPAGEEVLLAQRTRGGDSKQNKSEIPEKIRKRAIAPLIELLGDEDPEVREWAARSLGYLNDPSAVEPLISALRDEDANVREAASRSLGCLADKKAVPALINALKDEDANVRGWAVRTLGCMDDPRAREALIEMLHDEDADVRSWAVRCLAAQECGTK